MHYRRGDPGPSNPWIVRLLAMRAQYGDRIAISSGDETLSFSQLTDRAHDVAAALCACDVECGEPVAVAVPNEPAVVVASFGVLIAGGAEFTLDPRLGTDDISYAVNILDIRLAVTTAQHAPSLEALGVTVIVVDEVPASPLGTAWEADYTPTAWGKVVLTSGTTGRPKAILHSHERRWLAHLMLRAHLPYRPGDMDRILLMTPYAHGAGLLTAAFLDCGASVELMDGVDAPLAVRHLAAGAVNAVFAPPTVLRKLVEEASGPISGIRCIFCGTATLQAPLYHAATEKFGEVIRVTYGKSEVFNPITVLEAEDAAAYYRQADAADAGVCLGTVASGVELSIRDENGQLLESYAHGEIHVRAPHMLVGHVDSTGTHPFPPHGCHATGDMGYLDDRGRLFLTGRCNDVIKTGGYKLYPEEVERCLPTEMVVIGIPSQYWEEVLIAVGEEARVSGQSEDALLPAFAGLARYKQPRAVLAVPELPRNAQGKIPRAKVRELVLELYEFHDGPYPRFERR